jgi:hypothetical protein
MLAKFVVALVGVLGEIVRHLAPNAATHRLASASFSGDPQIDLMHLVVRDDDTVATADITGHVDWFIAGQHVADDLFVVAHSPNSSRSRAVIASRLLA